MPTGDEGIRTKGQRNRAGSLHTLSPLNLGRNGQRSRMGKEAATFYKRLADLLSSKRQNPYPAVMGWLRCRLSFASIRSAIMCIRGSRSSLHRPVYMDSGGASPPPEYIIELLIFALFLFLTAT